MTYQELFKAMETFTEKQMQNKVMVFGGNEEEFSSNTKLDYAFEGYPFIVVVD